MTTLLSTEAYYLLRTPVFPLTDLLDLHQRILQEGPLTLPEELKALFSTPFLREALYTSSPELYAEFEKWIQVSPLPQADRMLLSLYKYYLRLTSRATPYGLYAGCSTGQISEGCTQLEFAEEKIRSESRLDMNYVAELSKSLLNRPEIRQQILYYPNTSLYTLGDQVRYVEHTLRNKYRSFNLSGVKATPYIIALLKRAKNGVRVEELVDHLIAMNIDETPARRFVNQLIDNQLLISELEPSVTGPEFFYRLLDKLKEFKYVEKELENLEQAAALLKTKEAGICRYLRIKELVGDITATQSKDLIQTDLYYSTKANNLSQKSLNHLLPTLDRLVRAGSVSSPRILEDFKNRFLDRWETMEIPLAQALDSESGIGYGLTSQGNADNLVLLQQLHLPRKERKSTTLSWNKLADLTLSVYNRFIQDGQAHQYLTDADLAAVSQPDIAEKIPASLYAFGSFLASSPEALDQGDYSFLLGTLTGPSAANLLGRFCHGDEVLTRHVQESLRKEEAQYPDAIFAEIVHLPEARVGNILARPHLREYEISYLGQSILPQQQTLTLDDLMISVQADEIVLRSKKHNKRVFPRLSTAHNYSRGLAVYRFLADLQQQNTAHSFQWDWGIFTKQAYLPRISYQKVILSRARWYLESLSDVNPAQAGSRLNEFCQLHKVPRWVILSEGDNELPLDLYQHPARLLLLEKLKKKAVTLYEWVFDSKNCWVKDQGGSYTHEVILPLHRSKPSAVASPIVFAEPKIKRQFAIGSQWLYVKVYTGTKTADRVISEVLQPLTHYLENEGIIEKWFFIRYNDPKPHIRIRFQHRKHATFWMEVLQLLQEKLQPYLQTGLISKIMVDTYQQEIERYGEKSIELSEELFHKDSTAIADFLTLIEGEDGEQYRWKFALLSVDRLLNDFGYSLSQKAELMNALAASFQDEFGGKRKLIHQLNEKYRTHRGFVEFFLSGVIEDADLQLAIACFDRRSQSLQDMIASLQNSQGQSGVSAIEELLPSYIHMTLNRIFLSQQRAHELVIYHYLAKYYTSLQAQQKQRNLSPLTL